MKKNLLFIILSVLTFSYSKAQVSVAFGPEVGVHLSKSSYEEVGDEKSKAIIGEKIGLITQFKLGNLIAIQPGLFYNVVGYKVSSDSDLFSEESFKSTFNNLTLPVYINLEFGDRTKFFVGVGPEFNYMISGKYSGQFLGIDFDDEKIDFDDDDFNRFYMSANINAGFKFNDKFLLRFNYNLGITEINEGDDSNDVDPLKLGYYGVSFGYLFGGE